MDKKGVLGAYLGEYRIVESYKLVFGEGPAEEKKAAPGKNLGHVIITPGQLSLLSDSFPIRNFRPNRSGQAAYIVVDGLPENTMCELRLREPGQAILLIHGPIFTARYALEYEAGREIAQLSDADCDDLVIDPSGQLQGPGRLPEYRVRLTRVRTGARAVGEDYPENLGLRTKLGGDPDFIQEQDAPACKSCGSTMTFVAQIDSIDHVSKQMRPRKRRGQQDDPSYSRAWMFQDVGMIYVYYCFGCGESYSFVQSY